MGYDNRNDDRRDPPYTGPAMQALARHEKTRFELLMFVEFDRDKSATTRIGTAFVNKDGSINVLLDAVPIQRFDRQGRPLPTTLQLREPKPRDDDGRGRR